jgi:hypothetical protein
VVYAGAERGTNTVKIEKQGNRFEAKKLWSNPDVAPQYNTPVLKDGLLFGLSNRGNLYCINRRAYTAEQLNAKRERWLLFGRQATMCKRLQSCLKEDEILFVAEREMIDLLRDELGPIPMDDTEASRCQV